MQAISRGPKRPLRSVWLPLGQANSLPGICSGPTPAILPSRLFSESFLKLELATGYAVFVDETASGRRYWPNRDPIGIEGGINLYAFVRNGSIDAVDAFGLAPQIAVLWIPDNGPVTVQYAEPGMGVDVYLKSMSWRGTFPTGFEETVYPFDFDWHDFSKLQISIDATRRRLLEENRMEAQPVFIPGDGRLSDSTAELLNLVGALQAGRLAAGVIKTASGTIRGAMPKSPPVAVAPPAAVVAQRVQPAAVQIAQGAGHQSRSPRSLGGTVFYGGYDPAANALFLGGGGHGPGMIAWS